MDIEKKIETINDYFRSIERYEGKYYVSVCYPENWTAYKSSDEDIQVIKNEQEKENIWWYYSKSGNTGLGMLLRMVEETIQTNLEAIKKAQLYASKVEELKKIFADETKQFKDLEKLTFNMGSVIKPTKTVSLQQKNKKSKKTEEVEEISEEIKENHSEETAESVETVEVTEIDKNELDALRG